MCFVVVCFANAYDSLTHMLMYQIDLTISQVLIQRQYISSPSSITMLSISFITTLPSLFIMFVDIYDTAKLYGMILKS